MLRHGLALNRETYLRTRFEDPTAERDAETEASIPAVFR